MLRLSILPSHSEHPPTPEPDDSDVEVWCDNDGAVAGIGHLSSSEYWLHLPGLGSFSFCADSDKVRAIPLPAVGSGRIVDAYHRIVVPLALQVQGCEVLHASAVKTPFGILALCANKETGKSTLAYALHERGYQLWADDAVAFRTNGRTAEALSLPFRLRLRSPSVAFFGHDTTGEGWLSHPTAEPLSLASEALAAICVLARFDNDAGSPTVHVERCVAADALATVLTHAYCFSLSDGARKQKMMRHYLELISHTPVFRVRFRAGLQNLPAILAAIENAIHPAGEQSGAWA